jgi:hypothetical protein
LTQEGLFKQSLIQFLAWLILYLIISRLAWFEDIMSDGLVVILVMLISYLFSLVTIFFRPIIININQKDHNHKHLDSMGIVIENQSITANQKDRIIDVNIAMSRKKSFWWGILLKYLKNFKIAIDFRLTKPAVTLTPSKQNNVCEKNIYYGFNLNINEYLEILSENATGNYRISEKYCYYLSYDNDENGEHLLPDVEYVVVPRLRIEISNPTLFKSVKIFLIRLLIGFKPEHFTLNIKQR